jgi:hypothetical protein
LSTDPALGDEPLVRLGMVMFHMGRLEESTRILAQGAARSMDPFMAYLAHLVCGLAWDALRQPERAIRQYEAAYDVIPGAASAGTALGAAMFVAGLPHTERVFEQVLTGDIVDPWREYCFGDLRLWPTYVELLRAQLPR